LSNQARQPEPSPALLPFRGLRFDPAAVRDLATTIGPPADFDTSAEARAFVSGLPHNAVRLEIEDTSEPLSFSGARALLHDWLRSGVLRHEQQPAYYVYEQRFDDFGERRSRCAVFGLAPLNVPEVCILPHEETWEENRQRRLQLLRELDTGVSPVFLIYEGDGNGTQNLLRDITQGDPDLHAADATGNEHRLWVVNAPEHVSALQRALSNRHFIIADGHHRFAAAQLLHAERNTPETGLVLACCVEAHDPGIVIRPIHRLIHGRDDIDLLSAGGDLAAWFDIDTQPIASRNARDLARSLPDSALPSAAIVSNGAQTLTTLRLRDWSGIDALLPPDTSPTARDLDVTVITEMIIHRALQLDPTSTEAVTYADDPQAVLDAVASGVAGLGILMRPIRLQQVLAVARAHGRVPAKSTSFTPKVPVGLVMHAFAAEGDK
jgi:uncharacterized protein (DUF1015 family)